MKRLLFSGCTRKTTVLILCLSAAMALCFYGMITLATSGMDPWPTPYADVYAPLFLIVGGVSAIVLLVWYIVARCKAKMFISIIIDTAMLIVGFIATTQLLNLAYMLVKMLLQACGW